MIDYWYYAAKALKALVPNAEFKVKGTNYSGITWYSQNTEDCPSESALQTKIDELVAAEALRLLRLEKDKLLFECDWMANSDVTMSNAWKTYRQQLRDLPATQSPTIVDGYLSNVTWPTKPS
jgi:hypothetical protein